MPVASSAARATRSLAVCMASVSLSSTHFRLMCALKFIATAVGMCRNIKMAVSRWVRPKRSGSPNSTAPSLRSNPDGTIFPKTDFDFDTVVSHLRQQAYLVKDLRITIFDFRNVPDIDRRMRLFTCAISSSTHRRSRSISKAVSSRSSHSRTATRSRSIRIFSTLIKSRMASRWK